MTYLDDTIPGPQGYRTPDRTDISESKMSGRSSQGKSLRGMVKVCHIELLQLKVTRALRVASVDFPDLVASSTFKEIPVLQSSAARKKQRR